MKSNRRLRLLVLMYSALPLGADTVTLQNGKTLDGTFLGGNARQIDFMAISGESLRIPIDTLKSLTFTTAAPAAPLSSNQPAARHEVLIPAGTTFRVLTIDPINVDVAQPAMKFLGSLDDPIMSGGSVIVPRGVNVILVASKVAQGGDIKGSGLIELRAQSLTLNGRSYPVVASVTETKLDGEGRKTARKAIGGAGLGAIIGGIAGGERGAPIGAAGEIVVAPSLQPHLKIPRDTRLEFQLLADWKVQ